MQDRSSCTGSRMWNLSLRGKQWSSASMWCQWGQWGQSFCSLAEETSRLQEVRGCWGYRTEFRTHMKTQKCLHVLQTRRLDKVGRTNSTSAVRIHRRKTQFDQSQRVMICSLMDDGVCTLSFLLHESQHHTVEPSAASSGDSPDRLNCVTDRSRGLRACQGHSGATHHVLLPPADTTPSKTDKHGRLHELLLRFQWRRTGVKKTSRVVGPSIDQKVTFCSCSPEYDSRNNNAWNEQNKNNELIAFLWKKTCN